MTYDELIYAIEQENERQGVLMVALPHCSNLLFQLNKKPTGKFTLQDGKKDKLVFFNEIVEAYLKIRTTAFDGDNLETYIKNITEATNTYMNIFGLLRITHFHINLILAQVLSQKCSVSF